MTAQRGPLGATLADATAGSRSRAAPPVVPRSPQAPPAVAAACVVVFAVVWLALAIAPRYREDWLLENLLTVVAAPFMVWAYRRAPLSTVACVEVTVFLILHTVGSHYTYSEVPLGDWVRDGLGLTRNHYDRVVHFSFGLLMLRPLREIALRPGARLGPLAVSCVSVAQVLACSALYEIMEWTIAAVVDPAAGTAYLGTQGDVWDAQKDMACAAVGALLAVAPSIRALLHADHAAQRA